MGPVVNTAATVNKSGDNRPNNNSSNHGPSSHGNSNYGGNHKNYSYARKSSHPNQNHRHPPTRLVNNQQSTSSAQQPGRQHHHHNQQHNNLPPTSQQQPQSLPQPSQQQSAPMFGPPQQQQPTQLQHQQQKTHQNHQVSVTNSAITTTNDGTSISTSTNKNSQATSNVLQQQHTPSQQPQMPTASDKTQTTASLNPHIVTHQQPTPTSTNAGVGPMVMNPPHSSPAQPNIQNVPHHSHMTSHHAQHHNQSNYALQPINQHHQQHQQHQHHQHHHQPHQAHQPHQPHQLHQPHPSHHNHHHYQANHLNQVHPTQNSLHHNPLQNSLNAHQHQHVNQMVNPQLPVASNIGSVAPVQHKLAPQVIQQQPTQSQDGPSGQQKQQSNHQPPTTMLVSHHMQAIDHQHKTSPGVQHHVQPNTLIHHQSVNQANPSHSHHSQMSNLQQPSQVPHQSASVITLQQPQQPQSNAHNPPHAQHHQTPQINHSQNMPMHYPNFTYQPSTYAPPFILPGHLTNHHNAINQQAGIHLGNNNPHSPNVHMNFPGSASKYHQINQPNYSPQNAPSNASGAMHHTQQAQMHSSRQALPKGSIPPQMQQQQHDQQARQMQLVYQQYPHFYLAHPNNFLQYQPIAQQTFPQPHLPSSNVGSSEVDAHLQNAYTSSQQPGQGSHISTIPVSQSGIIPQITPLSSQQNTSSPSHPASATSQQASFPRPKESKKIPIVDPNTRRALTTEELLTPASKAGSVCSSTQATVDMTRSSISGSPEVRSTSSNTSSSPIEQSAECSSSTSKEAVAAKLDNKDNSNTDGEKSIDISDKSNIPKEEVKSIKDQDKLDIAKSSEQNQIAQDFSRQVAQAAIKDKDNSGKPQPFDVCDNSAPSSENIDSIGFDNLNLNENDIREKRSEISNNLSGKIDKKTTEVDTIQPNSPRNQVNEEVSKEATRSNNNNSDKPDELNLEKQSNLNPLRKESLKNDSPYTSAMEVPKTLQLNLRSDVSSNALKLEKEGSSPSAALSSKFSSEPHSEVSTPSQNEDKDSCQESLTADNKSGLPYEDGQYSPSNPNGRRKYSRDFLRKVAQSIGLPRPTPQQRVDFTPPFMQANAGYGQFNRETAQRRLSQQVNNKPRRVIATTSFQQEVELKTTKDPWKPALAKSPTDLKAEEIDTDRLIKIFRGHLNKLTPQKYDQLIEKIQMLELGTKDRMNRVIDLVFDKAVDEPSFCELYAKLCKVVGSMKTDDGKNIFSYALVKKCQGEFENEDIYDGLNVDERQIEIDETSDPQKRKQLSDELYEDMRLRRRKYLGTIKLIGEMYKLDLLLPVIIGVCMSRLIDSPTSENLECLCSLILTVGSKLSSSPDESVRAGLNNTLAALEGIAKSKANLEKLSLDVRIKFKILDIMEFRRRGWKPRNQENNPKMLDEIHREAAEETLLKNNSSYKNLADRKVDDRMKKVSGRPYESSLLNTLTTKSLNSNPSTRIGFLTADTSHTSLKPQSTFSRANQSAPNQNSDVTRLASLNLPISTNTSKSNPAPRHTNTKPITTQSNVNGSSSLNPKPVNETVSSMIPSDRHTEYQSANSISAESERSTASQSQSQQDMVIKIVEGCISKYDGHYMLERRRLTDNSKTILSLLNDNDDVSYQSLISGITDFVEQLGYPTHLLGDIFEHMITEGLINESEFSTWFTESRWSKARDSSPKFVRYLSEPEPS